MTELLPNVLTAVFAAGGAYAAVRVELAYIKRDVRELREIVFDWPGRKRRRHLDESE